MAPTPGTAAGTLNRSDAIADRPAGQRDKSRERVVPPLACHDRAKVGRVKPPWPRHAPVRAIEPASRWPSLKFTLLRINEYLSDRAASPLGVIR